MKIVQLVQKPQRRGAEVFASELSAWLRGRDVDVSTAYLYPYAGRHSLPLTPGDEVLGGHDRGLLERVPGLDPWLFRRTSLFLKRHQPDIVQVNGARTIKYGAAVKGLGEQAFRLVYRNIDSPVFWVKGRIKWLAYAKLIMRQVDGVVGVSQTTLDEVVSFYNLCDVEAEFIPNGVDFSKLDAHVNREAVRSECSVSEDEQVLLFCGSLSAQKRPERFLRVVARVARELPRIRGWLLGDGPDRALLERLAQDLDIHKRVSFFGFREDVGRVLSGADLLVSTSDTEGIPAVMLEAAYLSLPVVSFDVGGVRECVMHEKTGLLVPHPNESAMGDAIVSLLGDPKMRASLGRAGHMFVSTTNSIEIVGARYLEFYNRVLAR